MLNPSTNATSCHIAIQTYQLLKIISRWTVSHLSWLFFRDCSSRFFGYQQFSFSTYPPGCVPFSACPFPKIDSSRCLTAIWLHLARFSDAKRLRCRNGKTKPIGKFTSSFHRDFIACWLPGLVNSHITNWKITMLLMGKSTINFHFQ